MKNEIKTSPTQMLMDCMDEFSKVEPVDAIIVWTDEEGDLVWRATTNQLSKKVGLLECAKTYILEMAKPPA